MKVACAARIREAQAAIDHRISEGSLKRFLGAHALLVSKAGPVSPRTPCSRRHAKPGSRTTPLATTVSRHRALAPRDV